MMAPIPVNPWREKQREIYMKRGGMKNSANFDFSSTGWTRTSVIPGYQFCLHSPGVYWVISNEITAETGDMAVTEVDYFTAALAVLWHKALQCSECTPPHFVSHIPCPCDTLVRRIYLLKLGTLTRPNCRVMLRTRWGSLRSRYRRIKQFFSCQPYLEMLLYVHFTSHIYLAASIFNMTKRRLLKSIIIRAGIMDIYKQTLGPIMLKLTWAKSETSRGNLLSVNNILLMMKRATGEWYTFWMIYLEFLIAHGWQVDGQAVAVTN